MYKRQVEDKQIDNQISARMEYMAKRFGSEKNIVEAYGKSIETLKAELRSEIKEEMLSDKMQSKITEAIKVTPSEMCIRDRFLGMSMVWMVVSPILANCTL